MSDNDLTDREKRREESQCTYRCRIIGPHEEHLCVTDAEIAASKKIAFVGSVDELERALDDEKQWKAVEKP